MQRDVLSPDEMGALLQKGSENDDFSGLEKQNDIFKKVITQLASDSITLFKDENVVDTSDPAVQFGTVEDMMMGLEDGFLCATLDVSGVKTNRWSFFVPTVELKELLKVYNDTLATTTQADLLKAAKIFFNDLTKETQSCFRKFVFPKVKLNIKNVHAAEEENTYSKEDKIIRFSYNLKVRNVIVPIFLFIPAFTMEEEVKNPIKEDTVKIENEGIERFKGFSVKPVSFQQFAEDDDTLKDNGNIKNADLDMTADENNIALLLDVFMQVTVELGRSQMTIKDILGLGEGSIIELDKLAGEPVDILVNQKLIAQGEVVVIDESYAVRVTKIMTPIERVFDR